MSLRLVLIGSGSGGSGKTTVAVRLAEALRQERISTGIIDLSPFPSARWLATDESVPIVVGRSATTEVAARAMIKPYEEKVQVLFLDSGCLDDRALRPWLPLCTDLILTTRVDVFSLRSVKGIWVQLEEIRSRYAGLEFRGFLPTQVRPDEERSLRVLETAAKGHVYTTSIPRDTAEARRGQQAHFEGLEQIPAPEQDPSWDAFLQLASRVSEQLALTPEEPAEEPKKERGVLVRAWRRAASLFGGAKDGGEAVSV